MFFIYASDMSAAEELHDFGTGQDERAGRWCAMRSRDPRETAATTRPRDRAGTALILGDCTHPRGRGKFRGRAKGALGQRHPQGT